MTSPKNTYAYIGCDYYSTNISHLVIAMAEKVTADSYAETYYDGNQVIIMARDAATNDVYAFLAVASGNVMGKAGDFWPEYHKPNSPDNGIEPVTRIHKLPVDMMGKLGQRGLDKALRPAVATYLLKQGW